MCVLQRLVFLGQLGADFIKLSVRLRGTAGIAFKGFRRCELVALFVSLLFRRFEFCL